VRLFPTLARLLLAGVVGWCGLTANAAPETNTAALLRARQVALADQLANNPFQRPVVLDSLELPNELKGEVHAVVDYPFSVVSVALNGPNRWCDLMILHLNTKYCRAVAGATGPVLQMSIGKKYDQPLEQAYRVDFKYTLVTATPEFLEVNLKADSGPMGTSNYRIVLRAVALEGNKSFVQMSYSYDYGTIGRMAMQVYLATVGSGKVGFTVAGKGSNGEPQYIGGMRGVVERNTMRYYLAIDAYLSAQTGSPAEVLDRRLQYWFAATERYPRQLHETDLASYMSMKRNEVQRQQQPL
jgi:hypothetical protein